MPSLGRFVERVFAPFACDGDAPTWYSVFEPPAGTGSMVAYLGDERAFFVASTDDVGPMLLWHVNQHVCFTSRRHVMVHAGVVQHGDAVIVLPAPQESGKSTLVAALVLAGFDYLSDEAAAFGLLNHGVVPYPKPISLDPGSWSLLPGLSPQLDADQRRYAARQWNVHPDGIRTRSVGPGGTPRLVVAPRYVPGAATRIEPLTTAEAVVVLAENAFNLRVVGQAGLDLLADVARQCVCYRLIVGELDDAVSQVRSLVGAG